MSLSLCHPSSLSVLRLASGAVEKDEVRKKDGSAPNSHPETNKQTEQGAVWIPLESMECLTGMCVFYSYLRTMFKTHVTQM